MHHVETPAPLADEIEYAIVEYMEATPPDLRDLGDEQIEHAAEILGPRLFGRTATPSAVERYV